MSPVFGIQQSGSPMCNPSVSMAIMIGFFTCSLAVGDVMHRQI